MTDISRTQYILMRKINRKKSMSFVSMNDRQKEDLAFLKDKGYVCISKPATAASPAHYKVTAAGRASMYIFLSTFYKWWIPVIISICSLIVSAIALLC